MDKKIFSSIKDIQIRVRKISEDEIWEKQYETELTHVITTPFHHNGIIQAWWETKTHDDDTLYLIECLSQKQDVVASWFARKHKNTERLLAPIELVAFDELFFMQNIVCVRESSLSVDHLFALFSARSTQKKIRALTHADILIWHRLPQKEISFAYQKHLIIEKETDYPLIDFSLHPDYFQRDIVFQTEKDVRKQKKRMQKKFGAEPFIQHIDMGNFNFSQRSLMMKRVWSILRHSWQYKWMEESPLVDLTIYEERLTRYANIWATTGELHITILSLHDLDIACLVTLQTKETCWDIITGYDPTYGPYSVGKMVFLEGLRHAYENQCTKIHLGGNIVEWKANWLTHCPPLYRVEFPLCSTKGTVLKMKSAIKDMLRNPNKKPK